MMTFKSIIYSINQKTVSIVAIGIAAVPAVIYFYRIFIYKTAFQLNEKANELYNCGNYKEAIQCYSKAITKCSATENELKAKIYKNRAVIYNKTHKVKESLDDLKESLRLIPNYEKVYEIRSKIFLSNKKYREALADKFAIALINRNKNETQELSRQLILRRIAELEIDNRVKSPPILPSRFYIENFFQSLVSDPLLQPDDGLVEQSGNSNLSSALKCLELLRLGKYRESFESVNKVSLFISGLPEEIKTRIYLLRGTFYLMSCQEELALDHFDLVISNEKAKSSVRVNALIKRAMAFLSLEYITGIEETYSEAIRIDRHCPDIYFHQGVYFEKLDELDQAILNYEKALDLYPKHSIAAAKIVSLKSENGENYEECKKLTERFPDCPVCLITYIDALNGSEKHDVAEKILTDFLKSHRNPGLIFLGISNIKSNNNEDSEAIKILTESLEQVPQFAEAHCRLSEIFYNRFEIEKSKSHLKKAMKFARQRSELMEYVKLHEIYLAEQEMTRFFEVPLADVVNRVSM